MGTSPVGESSWIIHKVEFYIAGFKDFPVS